MALKNRLGPILAVFVLMNLPLVLPMECPEAVHPKTRSFRSLVAYQGNKISFDIRNSSMGNYVSFSFKGIDKIPKNAFLTFDSEHIIKLELNSKSIQKMSDGAFTSLSCLKYLTIRNNSLTELTWKTFDGLSNVRELDLSGNKIKELPDMTFQTMTKLEYLDLSHNLLRKFYPFTFANLSDLRHINLEKNFLTYIQPEVFYPLTSLEILNLGFNKFGDAEFQSWKLPTLEVLNLCGNYLRSFDTSLNYTFSNLRDLNLSSNYLTYLNIHALKKNFRKLNVIDLNHNYWRCDDLAKILHYLVDSRLTIPGSNTSEINELGIDCDNHTEISYDLAETTTVTTTTFTPVKKIAANINEVKIVGQIHNLSVKNDAILLEISGVRKLLIFSLLFFVLFVIVYASVQVGLCDVLKRKFNRREGYIDTTIQDNYSMLRP